MFLCDPSIENLKNGAQVHSVFELTRYILSNWEIISTFIRELTTLLTEKDLVKSDFSVVY